MSGNGPRSVILAKDVTLANDHGPDRWDPTGCMPPPEAMAALIRDTFRTMIKAVERELEDSGFQLSEWLTLKLMGSGDIRCTGDVSRELGMDSAASTRIVDRLESRQLLERIRSRTDRRMVGVSLTIRGDQTLNRLQPGIAAFWQRKLSIFDPADAARLFDLLARLRAEMSAEASDQDHAALPCQSPPSDPATDRVGRGKAREAT